MEEGNLGKETTADIIIERLNECLSFKDEPKEEELELPPK